MARSNYEIDDATAESIKSLWVLFRDAAKVGREIPSISVRRFNRAIDRESNEDALIDHLIAAEALLLHDTASPQDRGELGFRLALRCALLLESTGRQRRPTFKFMKRAYDLRSTVAHGGRPPLEVGVDGEPISFGAFVDELGKLMRDLVTMAATQYVSDPQFGTGPYWDRLLLGSKK